jgi:predicted Rdx family selenoprotein
VVYARLHRATWTSTELFLTFPPPALKSITIVPLNSEDTVGRFRIWLAVKEDTPPVLVWDRKVEGQFPELKILVSFPRSPRYYDLLLKWALRRNSASGIISSLIGRLATQINECVWTGGDSVLVLYSQESEK